METDTMSKLEKVFDTPNKKAFIGFLTAGDPDADRTVKFILEMEKAGADLIEIAADGLGKSLSGSGGDAGGGEIGDECFFHDGYPPER